MHLDVRAGGHARTDGDVRATLDGGHQVRGVLDGRGQVGVGEQREPPR